MKVGSNLLCNENDTAKANNFQVINILKSQLTNLEKVEVCVHNKALLAVKVVYTF